MKYTDTELLEILKENGYKDHEKNLNILKEGLDSDKYEISEVLDEARGWIKRTLKNKATEEDKEKLKDPENKKRFDAVKHGRIASALLHSPDTDDVDEAEFLVWAGSVDKEAARDRHKEKSLKESYSDYELYQILESNGYKTHEDNLRILKEGLDSGKYEITEEDILDEAKKHDMDPDKKKIRRLRTLGALALASSGLAVGSGIATTRNGIKDNSPETAAVGGWAVGTGTIAAEVGAAGLLKAKKLKKKEEDDEKDKKVEYTVHSRKEESGYKPADN